MKPTLQLTSLAFCFCFFLISCQKEATGDFQNKISSKDPQAISASIKVWHGVRTTGNPPAPRGNGLSLDPSTPIVQSFAGRYAIIEPQIASGDVKGYYLQVNGAKDYFNVDYSRPRITGRVRPGARPSSPFGRISRTDSTGGGNADSSIVIALPANFQVPDTFCVSYWAYDTQGNISNVVNTCIVVNAVGTDANGNWLANTWRITSTGDTSATSDTIIHNRYQATYEYECLNGVLSWTAPGSGGGPVVAADSGMYSKLSISLALNGAMKHEFDYQTKEVQNHNSCTQITHVPGFSINQMFLGAWNYNSATGKMILVFEYNDGNGGNSFDAWEYQVQKINNNHFLLIDNSLGWYSWARFEK